MLTHECKGNASYKHLSIKQENIDLYYKNKPRIFATVPEFTASASYVTEGKVKEIAAQGMVHSNEKASVRMKVTKDGKTVFDESKSIDPETGTGKIGELRFTTISQ